LIISAQGLKALKVASLLGGKEIVLLGGEKPRF
jgi:hypothetical protein